MQILAITLTKLAHSLRLLFCSKDRLVPVLPTKRPYERCRIQRRLCRESARNGNRHILSTCLLLHPLLKFISERKFLAPSLNPKAIEDLARR